MWAEYATFSINNIVKIPDNYNTKITLVGAASMLREGAKAYHRLVNQGKLKQNDKVLILDYKTGDTHDPVSLLLSIQIAKAHGASTISVSTAHSDELCKHYGATKIYNREREQKDDKHCWYKDLKGMICRCNCVHVHYN